MTTLTTTQHTDNRAALYDPSWDRARENADRAYLVKKDVIHRVDSFITWLDDNGMTWTEPDLAAYRDYLLNDRPRPLAPRSVAAHLSTIRGRYHVLLKSNDVRKHLSALAPAGATAADRKALIDEILVRISNAVDPIHAPVTVVTEKDVSDDKHLRLTSGQLEELVRAPGVETVKGIRDTAMLALMACTGIREAELAALDVDDLRHYLDGELSLLVREGKGATQRLIPYGDLEWCLLYVDKWLSVAGISEGAVFRSFWRGNKKVRPNRISGRAIIDVVQSYPVMVRGDLRSVNPHDLRRTYAKLQYEAGMDILRIKDNLGHADVKTTQGYIGRGDGTDRRGKGIIRNPHRNLAARWMIDDE